MITTREASPHRRYRLIAEIGRGGMAEVYLAVAQGPGGFNKLVVVKKTLQNLALQPDILAMFMDEARLAARMNHPNVVQTYEFGEEDGRHFIAMEYLDGQAYSRVLSRLRGRTGGLETMTLGHHLRVVMDTLAGLHHAHELRDFDGSPLYVVHRDISPQNVFITYDGSIKVVDFGIAKAQDSSARTVTGEIKGKVTYMSPEQIRGEPLDRRADLFSVGVMLWEAVAGGRMWRELPDMTVVHELIHGRIPSIRAAVPNIPPQLAQIIERALAPDREHRYPSALAMQRELDEFAFTSRSRVDGQEVGHIVSELFTEERGKVRAVVEAQLGSLRWTGENPAAINLPLIPAAAGSLSGSYQQPMSGSFQGPVSGPPTHSGAALPMPVAQPAPRRSMVLPVLAGALALAVVGGLAIAFLRPAPRANAPATTAAEPSASTEPKLDSVVLKVRATPADAKIFLDGVLLHAGTFEGRVPRSETAHVLRVEADGYQTKEETLVFTADVVTSFALEKVEASSTPSTTKPSATTQPTFQRPPTKSTGRGIDSESPYGAP
ncbi:MAG: serine/threonine-protein kinase [Polyangiaceae bacterium]